MADQNEKKEAKHGMKLTPGLMEILTIDARVLRVDRYISRDTDPRGFAVVGNRIYVRSRTDPAVYASVDELFTG